MLKDIQRKVIKDKVNRLVGVLKFGLRTGEPYYVYVDPDDRTIGLETGEKNRYLAISEEYFMFRYIGINDDGMKRLARFEIVIQANEKFGFNFGDRNSFLDPNLGRLKN
jgi:hypothetical protein